MKRQPWCSFSLANVNLTEFGLEIPSPFVSLELTNSEVTSCTSWTLQCTVGGDSSKKANIAAFEALLYTAAQAASAYPNASGIPVAFAFGWLDEKGHVDTYLSYQGFTLQFTVSTSGLYMTYNVTGFATLAIQTSMPVLKIPEVCGIVQPSAIVEALAIGVKATNYYELDIDHCDAPTLVSHGALTTSFNNYVRGNYTGQDDYQSFPGLLKLSKSYSGSRDAAGITNARKLSTLLNTLAVTPLENYLKKSNTDTTPQCASFSYWVDEPSMTHPGCIHYKSDAGLASTQLSNTLQYGTSETNILSLNGSYSGVAYNMTDMRFADIGFTVDGSGNSIIQDAEVVNSWSASLADVYQTVNIINDVSAIASQFSGNFTVQIPGSLKTYSVAQPVSLLVMTGNTVSPVSGIYNIMSVTHTINKTFVTTLKLQRLTISSANQVATGQGIYVTGSTGYTVNQFTTTSNIKSTHKVDFGTLYPDFTYMYNLGA